MTSTDQQMTAVLLELMMLMQGSTQAWNASGGRSADRDPKPSGEQFPLAEEYAQRYDEARDELAKQRVLHEARDRLSQWRGHGIIRGPGETQEATDARMVSEGAKGSWTVDEVARAFSCTPSRVRRACQKHEIEIDYRDILCTAGAVSRASLAQSLLNGGSTQQQVAEVLGIHQSNVSRLLKTARKAA